EDHPAREGAEAAETREPSRRRPDDHFTSRRRGTSHGVGQGDRSIVSPGSLVRGIRRPDGADLPVPEGPAERVGRFPARWSRQEGDAERTRSLARAYTDRNDEGRVYDDGLGGAVAGAQTVRDIEVGEEV